tara:strand:- start:13672 stop:15498 length:1827 start_codon:yes stop_codon:yes gene_type:complete
MDNTTPIDELLHEDVDVEVEDVDLFMTSSLDEQIAFMKEFLLDFPGQARDLFSSFDRKYRWSGVDTLASLLERVCLSAGFTGDIKLVAVESLLSFKEDLEEEQEPHINIKKEANLGVVERNKRRISRGIFCLNFVITEILENFGNDENVASIVVFDFILKLNKLAEHEANRDELEKKCEVSMKKLISLNRLESQYRLKLVTRINDPSLAKECYLYYLGDPGNPTSMRILAAQALLHLDEDSKDVILAQIEIFARDEELDVFIRADAADVMIGYGDEQVQQDGRAIIRLLGTRRGFGIYENTQNVHADGVEESVCGSLNTLKRWTTENEDKVKSYTATLEDFMVRRATTPRTAEELRDAETAMFRIEMGTRVYAGFTSKSLFCAICAWIKCRTDDEQTALWIRFDQELEDMVNTCTTGVISRLVNVLSGWDEFQIHITFKDQIKSNFAGRLNAIARALTNAAEDGNHPFYDIRKNDLANIYIHDVIQNEQKEEKTVDMEALQAAMADRGLDKKEQIVESPIIKIQSRQNRISDIEKKHPDLHLKSRQNFADKLFIEFCSAEKNRKCFHLFLGYAFSKITEELRLEFSKFVDADEFDMCVRAALAFYEGD